MDELVARLSRLDSCAVSDALDRFGITGAVSGIHRFSTERRIAGRVITVTLALAGGRPAASRHLCTTAIEAASPSDIIVVEQRTGVDAASWGGNLSIGAQVRGVAGVVVEGPVRDLDDSRRLDFPVFARTHTARTARGRTKTSTIRVLTTLLGHAAFPAAGIAALYAERWPVVM